MAVSEPSSSPPRRDKETPQDKSTLWSLAYSGTQLAGSVLLCLYIGYRLDKRWETSPWLTLVGAALGLFAGLYGFLKPFIFKNNGDPKK